MVYVAFVIDAFARRIIGWRAARSMNTALVLDALEHAIFTRSQEGITDLSGLVSHSDAGSQYTSVAFTTRLVDAGVDPSVGSVGDALDNALAETTVGSFKNELIWREGPWRDGDHVEIETLTWVDWFNTERPHEYLDDLTPPGPRSCTTFTPTHRHPSGDSGNRVSGHAGRSHKPGADPAHRPPERLRWCYGVGVLLFGLGVVMRILT